MIEVESSLGHEILTPDATTPVGLSNIPIDATTGIQLPCIAHIRCAKLVNASTKGNVGVRFFDDGTLPTKDLGMELAPGDSWDTCTSLKSLLFIGVAVNSQINVRYSPYPAAINAFPTR